MVFLDSPREKVAQSIQAQGSLEITNAIARALNKEEKKENKGWKRFPENIKKLYTNITFDGSNDSEKPAESLLDLLNKGNAQNLKVYLHFLLATENINTASTCSNHSLCHSSRRSHTIYDPSFEPKNSPSGFKISDEGGSSTGGR